MQFNSIQYLFFLPLIVLLYYLIPHRFRWILLLAGSYYFYMCWKVDYLVLIILSTSIDYLAGVLMGRKETTKQRLPYLILSLLFNFGLLFTFKYANFTFETLNRFFYKFDLPQRVPYLNVLLPVGISFYTFQSLSYIIEVFNGKVKAEKHPGYFALYVAYFPQLVAGPIERFTRLTPQLKIKHFINYKNFSDGFRLVLYGFFIKMVIADNLAIYVDEVYADPTIYSTFNIVTGLVFYSFQIYSDFYGYSLIAIGSAKFLGVNLMDNFRTPYFSRSIGEFWQRWHISLSTWFRDYLYIPLGGNRVKIMRWILNILAVFLLSGLWHGANWTFLIWGGIFGMAYLTEKFFTQNTTIEVKDPLIGKHTFNVMLIFFITTIAWIFFRSENLDKVKSIMNSVIQNYSLDDGLKIPFYVWLFFLVFILSDIIFYNSRFDKWLEEKKVFFRWGIYLFLLTAIIVFAGIKDLPFIYFQF
jgi:alginate O-acetyltransferase complex protein AlgI